MFTFLKANIASAVASMCDYLITIFAVQFLQANVLAAGIAGTLSGGVINFLMGRHWAFAAKNGSVYRQSAKYLLVWIGNLLLNVTGMYVLSEMFDVHYVFAKPMTSLLVAVIYNYPLQKKYVFKTID